MKNIKVTLLHHTPLYISADGARTCWASQDKSDTEHTLHCDSCNTKSIVDAEGSISNFIMNIGDANDHECITCGSMKNHWEKTIGPKDLALIDRVGNQFHHASILEHMSFNFFIDGISRACLQELARHRIASLSVKSSRYTLKELKDEKILIPRKIVDEDIECKYQGDGWWVKDGTPYYSDRLNHTMVYDTKLVEKYCVIPQNLLSYNKKLHYTNKGRMLWIVQENLKEGQSNDVAKYDLGESYRTQLTWTINMRSLQNFLSLRTDRTALPEIQHLAHLIYEALPADAQSLVVHCVHL